jgi:hypothetical protein
MLEDVIEQILHEMDAKIKRLAYKYKDADKERKKKMYGDIGETFVGRGIKFGLMDFGFDYGRTDTPCSFRITRQYGADSNGLHGVDFKVDIKDENNEMHTVLVEAKNWGDYLISSDMFINQILPRFTDVDKKHECYWFVTLNCASYRSILFSCMMHGINVIPLEGKITETSDLNEFIRPAIESFVNSFCQSILRIIQCEKCIKPAPDKMDLPTKTDKIKYYLRKGYPDRIICLKFNITQGHLSKIKNQMKKDGEWILDRRSKEAEDDKLL